MKKFLKKWYNNLKKNLKNILIVLPLIPLALITKKIFAGYADKVASNSVTDLLHENIPLLDLSFLYVYAWLIIISVLFLYPLIFDLINLHKVLFHVSFLLIIRSFFLVLTHLKAPVEAIAITYPSIINTFSFKNDLFFSGHTAVPLMGFFVFKNKILKLFFLISSIVMGFTVIIMREHYSIDVFAAFFIAYGSYNLGEIILKKITATKKKEE